MKKFKKSLSVLLACALLLSLLSTTAIAALGENASNAPIAAVPDKATVEDADDTIIPTKSSDPDSQVPTNGDESSAAEETGETDENDSMDETAEEPEFPYVISELGIDIGGDYIPIALSSDDGASEDGIMPASLLPLKEYYGSLDLSNFMPEDAQAVKLETVWTLMTGEATEGEAAEHPANAKIMWSTNGGNSYQSLGEDGVMDLSDCYSLTLIVGPNADDQLDPTNVRYRIDVTRPESLRDLFSFELYSSDKNEKQEILNQKSYGYRGGAYDLYVKNDFPGTSATLRVIFNEENTKGVRLDSLYAGDPETGTKISDNTATVNGIGSYSYKEFTAILTKDGKSYTYSFYIDIYTDSIYVGLYYGNSYEMLLNESGESVCVHTDTNYDDGIYTRELMLKPDLSVNGKYGLRMEANNSVYSEGNYEIEGVECISRAVVGRYTTLEEAAAQPDIKADLFGHNGYLADYSQGVDFTIFDVYGDCHTYRIKTVPYVASETSPSTSTGFYISDVYKSAPDAEGYHSFDDYISSYVISSTANDSMGNIYQTVLLLDDGKPVTADVIYPTFYTNEGVNVYLGVDKTSGEKQISGVSPVPFKSGEAVQYSAASESGTHLQNIYVTFVTPSSTEGELFVPGSNVQDQNYDEKEGIHSRVIHLGDLDNPNSTYYDVLFANVGQQELTGIYVKLENAENVRLDDYWTVVDHSTKKLGAFSTTSSRAPDGDYVSNGALPNLAKVRLLPEYDEDGEIKHGRISGYLVIGADGVDEVRIKLTGIAGKPKIVTENVVDGTKFVPYDTLIQTNNVGEPDAVKFEFSLYQQGTGKEEIDGVSNYPNGEIYGIPQETGTYTLYASLYSSDDEKLLDRKEFEITIQENTDDNVWNASDEGYEILNPVGVEDTETHYILDKYAEQVFRSNGEYQYYVDFYLDGQKLEEGTDYTSGSGSTVITLLEETLANAGTGTHTIAAEFHEMKSDSGLPNGSLKRTAQNYTVQLKPAATPTPTPTATPTPVPTPTPTATPAPTAQPSASEAETVTCEVTLMNAANDPIANAALELHSTPQTATTDQNGNAVFQNVELGNHTLYVSTSDGNKASFSFTLSSEAGPTEGNTIHTVPGAHVKLTFCLDGETLTLVSSSSSNPQTGDNWHFILWCALFGLSFAGLATVVCLRKGSSKRRYR